MEEESVILAFYSYLQRIKGGEKGNWVSVRSKLAGGKVPQSPSCSLCFFTVSSCFKCVPFLSYENYLTVSTKSQLIQSWGFSSKNNNQKRCSTVNPHSYKSALVFGLHTKCLPILRSVKNVKTHEN